MYGALVYTKIRTKNGSADSFYKLDMRKNIINEAFGLWHLEGCCQSGETKAVTQGATFDVSSSY